MGEPSLLTSCPGDVKALLQESLPWSPLDCIRGISRDGDRRVQFGAILRDLPAADDLRIVCPISAGTDVAVWAERLPWDSAFFGYEVARLHGVFPLKGGYAPDADYEPAVGALLELARGRGIRYLFGVVDARDLPAIRALSTAGFALVETRVCLHRSLRVYQYPRRFQCRRATEADLDGLAALAERVDNPYDRFNADPFIAKADVRRLMTAWLRASVLDGFADGTFVPDGGPPRAVCTLKYHTNHAAAWGLSIAQLVLAIAEPGTSRLVGLISEVNYHLKDAGVDHVFFTTQIANRPAIRVGEHLGYRLGRAEYVFRRLL